MVILMTVCGVGLCVWMLFTSGIRMETVELYELDCGESVTAYDLVTKINRRKDVELTLAGKGSLSEKDQCMTFEKPGTYTVLLKARTNAHYTETEVQVRVRDTDPPQLECEDFTIVVGEAPDYLAHVKAWDQQDGDLAQSVKIDSSKITLDLPGSYEVSYSVSDQGGNRVEEKAWLTIRQAPASEVYLSETELWLCVNEFAQLRAYVEPENWDGTVEWSSDDSQICTVVDGFVYCRGTGTCVITAKADDKTEECVVHCTSAEVSTIWLNQRIMELGENQTARLKWVAYPSNWHGDVAWTSSDPSVATVEDGLVTWQGRGTCTITVYGGGVSDSCSVTCAGKTLQESIFESLSDLTGWVYGGRPH